MNEHTKEPESFMKQEPEQQPKQKEYNSNPFTLAIDAFGRFFETNKGWAIALIVLGLLNFIIQGINTVVDIVTGSAEGNGTSSLTSGATGLTNPSSTVIIALIVGVGIAIIVTLVVSAVVTTYVRGMLSFVALQSEKGKAASFSEAFSATSQRFWILFGALTLSWLKILGWSILFIVPGIIASLRYRLLPYVVMSQPVGKKSIAETHDRMKQIAKGRLIEIFGVSFASSIIPIIGSVVNVAGGAAQHNQLAEAFDTDSQKPVVHWLNKLLLGAAIALVLFVIMLAIVIVLFISSQNF